MQDGYGYTSDTNEIYIVPNKYFNNLVQMWPVALMLVVGVVIFIYGTLKTILTSNYIQGIWPAGIGTVLVVLSLLLCAGWNNTVYYPSNAELKSSLTIANSCSSEFTLRTMSIVSILVPFVVAYIAYVWRVMDKKKINEDD